MRRFLSAAMLAALSTTSSAFAADLAVKAPRMAPPVETFSWTGCYVGGHIGAAISQDRTTNVFGQVNNFSSTGFVGGGQVGCDYQFAPNWVIGAEGRAAWSSLKSTHASSVTNLGTGLMVPAQFSLGNDFLASATARLGYSFAPAWLIYGRGGAAWTREKVTDAFTIPGGPAVAPTASSTRTGWTVGGGAEWIFAPHWSTNLEYNYYDFGSHTTTLVDAARNVTVSGMNLRDQIHTVTVGVNYRF
ncbi:outer membrane protein [Bradyrhizobium sp. HKCCYLS1011]|uniref:outer membrane protein n=1 Tax=Bradyrhizobium sp. HKCCYLS1011 TaxID=3420733 RepID=UPI003EB8A42B